jgi:tRNA threonylcarbamoyladenosine biosynthesis protein TsaB
MGCLASERLKAGRTEDVAYFEPFYLKEYKAVISKNKVLNQ